jgi:ferredoxin
MIRGARDPGPVRLVVDPARCDGIGMCALVARRVVDLDPWGYPLLPLTAVPAREFRAARAAVRACPRRALLLEPSDDGAQPSGDPPVTPST